MLHLGFNFWLNVFFCLWFAGKTNGRRTDVVTVVVKEGEDAILPCSISSKENIVRGLFDWKKDGQKEVFMYNAGVVYQNGHLGQDEQFKGRVSHFSEQLEFGNASITITNTKQDDSGNYTCVFPRTNPGETYYIRLVVVAAPNPTVLIADVTEAGVLLQCVVHCASPEPKLQWKDCGGNLLPAEEPQVSKRRDHYNVILQTTVTKTTSNCFYCEVKQDEIGHIVNKSITVPEKLFDDKPIITVPGFMAGFCAGLLTAIAAGVVLFIGRKYVWKKDDQRQKSRSNCGTLEPLASGPV
ncbi:butyrophilin-like protein 1 isoform X2 [Betta splendens]|uniref:Butyrophilin-like protein 1 isoform X2 n=1 Tax=Betta splendens TaxID=158456 RepID=A0A6P7LWN9_BETSP|nr:butyrophilin-like protein 1 isoform X2 [Betta splendens]